jgi:hypothetical protein
MTTLQRISLLRKIRKAYTPLIATIALCGIIIFSRVQRVSSNDSVTTCKPAPPKPVTQAYDIEKE